MIIGHISNEKVVPAAWALLPGKGIPVYRRVWSVIKEVIKENCLNMPMKNVS